jgi:hypothetical protein
MAPALAPVLIGLAGCAVGPNTSFVAAPLAPADARLIAAGIGTFLRSQLPTASTSLVLDPTAADQADNALTPMLADTLRQQGFAVATAVAPQGAHTLRYWVTPLDASGELVRLRIDGRTQAAQFFARDTAGALQAGGPFTVMQAEASL